MEEALGFFRAFEAWIYLLLALGGLIYVRKFIIAWRELRGSSFGLERESAQARLNQAASVLVLLLTMAVTEFVLVSFIAPEVPGASPLPTATLDLLATPTTTLSPPGTPGMGGQTTPVPATLSPILGSGCTPGQIEITSPAEGQEINGIVEVVGTADIPNFGFYKFEMKGLNEAIWQTLQAGREVKKNSQLGFWDTRRLQPGEYQLGLVVVNNQGQSSQPCIVQVRVIQSPEETTNP